VIDLVATDMESLLRQLEGRSVMTPEGPVTVHAAGALMQPHSMNLAERVLQVLSDPNIAYVLFTIGLIGLAAELYNPGLVFPGMVGAISLILGLVAFGNLPVNWGGVTLVGLAIALLIAEVYTEGIGILAAGGVTAFVLGSLMLYRPADSSLPGGQDLRVSWWLIAIFTGASLGFFFFVLRSLARARRMASLSGPESLIGRTGIAVSQLAPLGRVRLQQESWQAEAANGSIRSGELVEIISVAGVTLKVKIAADPVKPSEANN
jgi:membrane-bound serine protease (ClpP class)